VFVLVRSLFHERAEECAKSAQVDPHAAIFSILSNQVVQ
jgi:hypothetical protein